MKHAGGRPTKYSKELGVIYAVFNDDGVVYIGQTKNFKRRLSQYCSISNNMGNRKIEIYIRSILEKGKYPKVHIIEETTDLDQREQFWIKYYRDNGANLLNMNEGGPTNIVYIKKAKKNYPWAKTQAPMLYRMNEFSRMKRYFQKIGDNNMALIWDRRIELAREWIKIIGSERLNYALYNKYGR